MKRLILLLSLFLFGCNRWYEEDVRYGPCNWTSDNKVVFIEEYVKYRKEKYLFGGITSVVVEYRIYIWEVDTNQNYRKIGLIWTGVDDILGVNGISNAGNWVVFGFNTINEIWLIKRDGSNLHKLTNGKYPDFSPDAQKVVFVRNDGLYVINRDGSGIKRIVDDPDATRPAWSSDGGRIAYLDIKGLKIIDTSGNLIDSLKNIRVSDPDWGPADSNFISFKDGYFYDGNKGWYHVGIFHLNTREIDTLFQFSIIDNPFISPAGDKFIAKDKSGYFVIKRDGTNKWYIKP